MASAGAQRLIRISVLGLLSGMALSCPLWFPVLYAPFPITPIGDGIPENPVLISGLSVLMVLNAVALFWMPGQKMLLPGLFVLIALNFGFNLNTAQPWVWCYWLLFWALWLDPDPLFAGLVAVSIYWWGGIFKVSPYFAEDNFPWFCGAFSWLEGLGKFPSLGYAIAVCEALFAPALWWIPTRRIARVVLVLFHLGIVLVLSPLGHDWNTVVIPWNIALASFVWVAFSGSGYLSGRRHVGSWFLPGLVWLAPAFNFWGIWPDMLSWKLYSNTQAEATFYTPEPKAPCAALDVTWRTNAFNSGQYLLLDDWAQARLHVPLVVSTRVLLHTGKWICDCMEEQKDSAGVYLLRVEPWRGGEHVEFYPCRQIR
ncbi:MAG: hypothetical protein KGS48_05350 [Bacteroidetes bacterium]|nr:hypothetical protein [Bacteroidota bacterium]